ncbi:MAG: ribonuclease H family protein [Saprospiraceae bacterium]
MSKNKEKYYVVWAGNKPGIYHNWNSCKEQIMNFPGAKYKSFPNLIQAEEAYNMGYHSYAKNIYKQEPTILNIDTKIEKPKKNSICVDAACSGNPGILEYRGVYTKDGSQIFYQGPFKNGTNNIGEFLAIVHALALLKQKNIDLIIYSDSDTAIKWVKNKKANTKLNADESNSELFDLIERAEIWLSENTYNNNILKWQTKIWGEIPADFGRK